MVDVKDVIFAKLDDGRRHGTGRSKIYASIKLIHYLLDSCDQLDFKKAQILRKLRKRLIEQLQSGNESTLTLAFTSANSMLDKFSNLSHAG